MPGEGKSGNWRKAFRSLILRPGSSALISISDILHMLDQLTGGGGGQGLSAFGGAIDAGRVRAFGMLSGVVCHLEKEGKWGGVQGQIYFFEDSKEKKREYGRNR